MFLAHEAKALDERRFDDWLAMLDDEVAYHVPIRLARLEYAAETADGGYRINDDKRLIRIRIERLKSGHAWAETPPSRTLRMVGSVLVERIGEDRLAVESALLLYKDWLDERGEAMNHIGFRLADGGDYEAALAHYAAQGMIEAMSGWFHAPGGNCKWAYLDTRAQIGCYTELYYVDGVALEAFENFRDGKSHDFIPGSPSERP